MSSNSSGKKLEGFFTGKGFYIVLFLCAAVIGVSAWMMAAGNEAMDDLNKTNNASFDNKRVETIIIPPEKTAAAEPVSTPLPVIAGDAKTPTDAAEQGETEQVWREGDVKPVEVPPEIKPWEKLSDPEQVMKNCYKAVQDVVSIMPPGWVIGNISCTPGGLTTSWSRQVGRISWIEKALDMSGITFSGRSISDDGNSLIASVPLDKIRQISSPPLKTDIDLKNTLNNLFQSIGQTVNLSSFSYTSPQQNVYRSVKFKFTSTHNPVIWNDLLIKFSKYY